MINFDHWARVKVGLNETPSLRICFNVSKNMNTKKKIKI